MDRFLPMTGNLLSEDTWGADNVLPRYIDNGIEDRDWSYWGGNVIRGDDGRYHLFVCGWPENSPRGHMQWPESVVFHAVSDNAAGPFVRRSQIGKGHNPEIFRAKDGRYVLYVIDGRYVADRLEGPWEYGKFEFDARDRRIIEGLSNLSFAPREDGSVVMVCRGGGIWISETGLSPYNQVTHERVYPDVDGRFEDPVIWRDHVQYHLIVNDWLGRIAYYLRSKDGVSWVVDPGEAYAPGIAVHSDGRLEDWFKYERMKVLQDEHGRAIQANFAVIDVLKRDDKPGDRHSSKNISIPLNPGMLLTIVDGEPITADTESIRVRIHAEPSLDPLSDIAIDSLRFGASTEVNFGRGSKPIRTEAVGRDLMVTFAAAGHGITAEEFAPKVIGRTKGGALLHGFARLPTVEYLEPILSPRKPVFHQERDVWQGAVEVRNFGQVASKPASLQITILRDGTPVEVGVAQIPALEPYQKTIVTCACRDLPENHAEVEIAVTVDTPKSTVSRFPGGRGGPSRS